MFSSDPLVLPVLLAPVLPAVPALPPPQFVPLPLPLIRQSCPATEQLHGGDLVARLLHEVVLDHLLALVGVRPRDLGSLDDDDCLRLPPASLTW